MFKSFNDLDQLRNLNCNVCKGTYLMFSKTFEGEVERGQDGG